MMVRVGVAGWLFLCAVSCGRATHDADDDAMSAGASTASTSGSSQGGNTTSHGGNASSAGGGATSRAGNDPGEEAPCEGYTPTCVLTCASFEGATSPDCIDQQYVCPKPSRTFESCPDDACGRRTDNCCSATGHRTVPDCAADGTIGLCPEGYEVPKGICLPQGVDIHDCSELQTGDACTDPDLVCYTGRCSRNCTCEQDEAGKLHWSCSALPC